MILDTIASATVAAAGQTGPRLQKYGPVSTSLEASPFSDGGSLPPTSAHFRSTSAMLSMAPKNPTPDGFPPTPVPIRPRRKIRGMSAMLLPMKTPLEVDWVGFTGHLARTVAAGLTPAVNMDTGYANLIPDAIRQAVLERTAEICGAGGFVAGAYVADAPDSRWNEDAYRRTIDDILARGGLPIVFQSYGLAGQDDEQILRSYERLGAHAGPFLAFELGTMFAPFGKIYSLDLFRGLLEIEQCVGAKHSSLCRAEEWERLRIRDAKRPDFMLLTGNDLAIDMVMYGSDYLLGLSTFDPLAFALRDRYWEQGDPRFYELNDWLQYLGMLVFRAPVPGYKHNAAQFLARRGWIENPIPYAGSPLRPTSDSDLLEPIAARLEQFLHTPEQPPVTAPDP